MTEPTYEMKKMKVICPVHGLTGYLETAETIAFKYPGFHKTFCLRCIADKVAELFPEVIMEEANEKENTTTTEKYRK